MTAGAERAIDEDAAALREEGFVRVVVDGRMVSLDEVGEAVHSTQYPVHGTQQWTLNSDY